VGFCVKSDGLSAVSLKWVSLPPLPADIRKAGGIYEGKEVIVNGNLVTSRYPGDLPAFMRETILMARRNLGK
jgi:putative intracellular protease/amidase